MLNLKIWFYYYFSSVHFNFSNSESLIIMFMKNKDRNESDWWITVLILHKIISLQLRTSNLKFAAKLNFAS